MCSHCGTIRNYREIIKNNFGKIKERKEKVSRAVAEAAEDHAIDPCSANEALLLEDIIEILSEIGIIDEVGT
uniref:Uncharacterized protein n=1 Tax=viral metagenome TaxID=1070528 RepID=A0A6M3JZQ8_9ZZZZ